MSNSIDLRELWKLQASAEVPAEKEIFIKTAQLKKRIRNKSIAGILALLATIAGILFVWFTSDLQMLSTKIGVTLIIIAILLTIINSAKIIFSISTSNLEIDNSQYLNQLLKLKKQQEFAQTTIMTVYYILLAVGLGLYMYEPSSRMTAAGMAVTYGVTFAWIAFSWFYLLPKTIKKQQAKMNDVIEKLKLISKQL